MSAWKHPQKDLGRSTSPGLEVRLFVVQVPHSRTRIFIKHSSSADRNTHSHIGRFVINGRLVSSVLRVDVHKREALTSTRSIILSQGRCALAAEVESKTHLPTKKEKGRNAWI